MMLSESFISILNQQNQQFLDAPLPIGHTTPLGPFQMVMDEIAEATCTDHENDYRDIFRMLASYACFVAKLIDPRPRGLLNAGSEIRSVGQIMDYRLCREGKPVICVELKTWSAYEYHEPLMRMEAADLGFMMPSEGTDWKAMALKLVMAMTSARDGNGKTQIRLGVITDILQSSFGFIIYLAQTVGSIPQPQLVVGEPVAIDGRFGLFHFILLAVLTRDEAGLPEIDLPETSTPVCLSSSSSSWNLGQGTPCMPSGRPGLTTGKGENRTAPGAGGGIDDPSTQDMAYDVEELVGDRNEKLPFTTSTVKIFFDIPGYNRETPRILSRAPTTLRPLNTLQRLLLNQL
ncbi:hypothetical protein FRB95_002120 [Tulasnella sp. JGI-2019a]|nr:hypothetical protein FRB95_002120 [Tulasnella sp. JGI-2019a]